jgi:hypothetical protein
MRIAKWPGNEFLRQLASEFFKVPRKNKEQMVTGNLPGGTLPASRKDSKK